MNEIYKNNFIVYYFFLLSLHKNSTSGCGIRPIFFWRTNQQQEIDYIEECDGQFSLFEMKWNPKRANTQFPNTFLTAYDVKEKVIVTPENWLEWVL